MSLESDTPSLLNAQLRGFESYMSIFAQCLIFWPSEDQARSIVAFSYKSQSDLLCYYKTLGPIRCPADWPMPKANRPPAHHSQRAVKVLARDRLWKVLLTNKTKPDHLNYQILLSLRRIKTLRKNRPIS